jgi:uncharacterized protein with gpF-like domain
MPDTPRAGSKTAYIKKIDDLTRHVNGLEDEAVRNTLRLLRQTLETIQARILTADGWQLSNLTSLQRQVNDLINRFQAELTASYAGIQAQAYQTGTAAVDAPLKISGVSVSPAVLSRNVVAVLQGYSADLIKSVSDELRTMINTTLTQHLLGLSSPFAAMQRITQLVGVSDSLSDLTGVSARAEKIFRTETMRVYNISTEARQQQIAETVPDLMKVWVATGDHRTRRAHLVAHGQMVRIDQPFMVGGEALRYPLDPRGSASNTINCRCRSITWRAGYGAPVPATTKKVDAEKDRRK